MIRLHNLERSYPLGRGQLFYVLRDIDLDIAEGGFVSIMGPSGAGKSTLLHILGMHDHGWTGEYFFEETAMHQLKPNARGTLRNEQIGFVFQQYNLLPALTAAENAAVPLLIAGEYRTKAVRTAKDLLTEVGLEPRMNAYPSQLSGGQQQRVAIARALIHQPRLMVCDEPTAALDAQSGQTVMQLLKRVGVQPDRALIIVTHDSRVYGFGDRIVHMSDGRIERVEEMEAAAA